MADEKKPGYLYVPEKTWWTLRRRFAQSMPREVSASYLAGVMNVSPGSTKNTLPSLRGIGLIDDTGKPTELANRWRDDSEYLTVCEEIRNNVYPPELLDLFPEPVDDSTPLRNWFKNKMRVGEDSARKMASFYQLLLDADPNKANAPTAPTKTKTTKVSAGVSTKPVRKTRPQVHVAPPPTAPAQTDGQGVAVEQLSQQTSKSGMSLHIDIQIHISPEATPDQIDKIFESMAKHLPLNK